MADKKFYLSEDKGQNWSEIDVEISPILAQTLDETIDNITISLALNQRETPYSPIATEVELVQVYDDETTETINKFVVSADNVELMTENPIRYKHTLTLVQRAQFLTKKEMRNTVFSSNLNPSAASFTIAKTIYIENPICNTFDKWWEGSELRYLAKDLALRQDNSTNYVPMSQDGIVAKIDLSKTKIYAISYKKRLMAQLIKSEYGRKASGSYEMLYKLTFDCIEPSDFRELTKSQNSNYWVEPYIFVEIYDSNNIVIDSRTEGIGFEYFNDETKVNLLSNELCEWLRTYDSGTAVITLKCPINTHYDTWNNPLLKDGKIPFLYNMSVDLFITSQDKSCYKVIETLLLQQLKETKNYNRTTHPTKIVPLFKLPSENHNPSLYQLLLKTEAPNFVFTQGNFYEILVEIFKMFDAIFTIDEDEYLDIEYYNEHEKTTFTDSQKAGRQSSLGEERYANRLISYYQNAKIDDKFPNSNQENATSYIRSKSIGIPEQSDFVFMVPKPIDMVTNVAIGGFDFDYVIKGHTYNWTQVFNSNPEFPQDTYTFMLDSLQHDQRIKLAKPSNMKLLNITRYVNEESIWSILNEDKNFPIDDDYSIVGKYNSLVYKKGTNYIEISKYYDGYTQKRMKVLTNVINSALHQQCGLKNNYDDTIIGVTMISESNVEWQKIKMAVNYIAICDGKIVNESIDYKYDGGILINQNNGSIDINKLGLNMVGLSLKLGQPTLTMTQKICKWEDRVRKGQFIEINGERWVANTCNYTLINKDLIEASIEFVKNFNGLASRIELNREKRLSNISNELTTKCEENYGEFVYYTTLNETNAAQQEIALSRPTLFNQIAMGFGFTIPAFTIDYSDQSSKINVVSIATLNSTDYTNQTLEKVTGYVENEDDDVIVLNSASDFSGSSVIIPQVSDGFDYIYWDILNDCFAYDENAPKEHLTRGVQYTIYVLKIGEDIIGGNIRHSEYFNNTVPRNKNKIEYASLTALKENGDIIKENEYFADHIAVPMVVYGSGNSICFELSCESPMSVGTQLLYNYSGFFSDTRYWFSKYVLYTNKAGEATKFTIDFVMLQENLNHEFPKLAATTLNLLVTFPFLDFSETPLKTYSFGKLEEFAYYKKPNEIFALNYQLHFLPNRGTNIDFLSNEFIKNNGFANGLNTRKFHIMYSTSDDLQFDIFDVKALEDDGWIRMEIINAGAFDVWAGKGLEISYVGEEMSEEDYNQIKSWAICDEEDNIYFASNEPPKNSYPSVPYNTYARFHIFFYARHFRKEE